MLVVISGLPGTGKTAIAAEIARKADAVHLSIDTVEDALLGAGCPRSRATGVAAYEAVRAAAEQNLDLGRTVVVDAVNDMGRAGYLAASGRDDRRSAGVRPPVLG